MTISFQSSDQLTNFLSRLSAIQGQGNFNPQMKLPAPPKPKTLQMSLGGLRGQDGYQVPIGGLSPSDDSTDTLDRLEKAIRSQESSDRYSIVNPDSGAAGAYQMMPDNISEWSKEALGHSVSLQQFLNSPQIQDQIATYKLKQYLSEYGAAGAAVAWYGGPGAVSHMYDNDPQPGGYPSLYAYWQSVLNKM